jgi:hypothetical protein
MRTIDKTDKESVIRDRYGSVESRRKAYPVLPTDVDKRLNRLHQSKC